MTTETPFRSVKDMMKANPEAFNFDDIAGTAPGSPGEMVQMAYSLPQMLGEFEFVKRDKVSGILFWGRKPKLNGLRKFVQVANSALVESPDGAVFTYGDRLAEICALLLYIPKDDDMWRPATIKEIGDAFDPAELSEIMARFSGNKKETDEGNAQTPTSQ